jgi:tripartite-type tricarboxylate transporter receptor subunit TctC
MQLPFHYCADLIVVIKAFVVISCLTRTRTGMVPDLKIYISMLRPCAAIVIAIFVTLLAAPVASADDYPSHPIRIIVPFAAGGPSDAAGRIAAASLTRYINQNVYVDDRTGGGGMVGTQAAATAPPDGYTLFLSDAATFVVVPLSRKVDYDVEKDFVGLGQIASAPHALVVNAKSKFKSVGELVNFAHANPGKISFGSAGVGSTTHLSIELLQDDASIALVHVPYRGTSLSIEDVLSQNIDAIFGDVATLVPFINSGKVVALATTGDNRSLLLPDVPTMTELGYNKVRMVNWFGLHVTAATPPNIQTRLKEAVASMQADHDFVASLAKIGTTTGTKGADAFNAMVAETRWRLGPVIHALGPLN